MAKEAVILERVTKRYKLYKNDKQRFKALFSRKVPCKIKNAVFRVSFKINKGESVALIGRNGAGKSTILKMISGVAFPTWGKVIVNGRVSALLELGAGFDMESTGRENIYLKCRLMGMTDKQIKKAEKSIIKFADIGEYIDQPLRSYSSGMKARLGFAINTNINPDILIVDEALSVGDSEFRVKCLKRINKIREKGDVTFIFVTHSLMTAAEFCERGIVFKRGKLVFDGDIKDAIEYYETNYNKRKTEKNTNKK